MTDQKTEKTKPNRKLLPGQIKMAEYDRADSVVMPEQGTSLQEMLQPEYWAHVASSMRPWQRLEVRSADGAWWAELLVRVVKPFAARVHLLRHVEFDRKVEAKSDIDVPEGYELKFRGPKTGWTVVRLEDGAILKEQEPNKVAAAMWLQQYLKELAA